MDNSSELKNGLGIDEWLELIKEDKNLNGSYISIAQYIYLIEKENQETKELLHKIMTSGVDEKSTPVLDLYKKNQELKKQLEEWKHHLECSKEMLDIQGQKGNYDYDEYMLGLYNGMEYIIALFETREPNYISGKDVKFTNNKTQQKGFIKYLQEEKNKLAKECSHIYEDSLGHTRLVNEDKFNEADKILNKYKEIIGVSDENTIN